MRIGKGLVNSPISSCSANPQSLGSINIQLINRDWWWMNTQEVMITPLHHKAMNLDVKHAKRTPPCVNACKRYKEQCCNESAMLFVLYAIIRNYWEESWKCSMASACFIFKMSFTSFNTSSNTLYLLLCKNRKDYSAQVLIIVQNWSRIGELITEGGAQLISRRKKENLILISSSWIMLIGSQRVRQDVQISIDYLVHILHPSQISIS